MADLQFVSLIVSHPSWILYLCNVGMFCDISWKLNCGTISSNVGNNTLQQLKFWNMPIVDWPTSFPTWAAASIITNLCWWNSIRAADIFLQSSSSSSSVAWQWYLKSIADRIAIRKSQGTAPAMTPTVYRWTSWWSWLHVSWSIFKSCLTHVHLIQHWIFNSDTIGLGGQEDDKYGWQCQ